MVGVHASHLYRLLFTRLPVAPYLGIQVNKEAMHSLTRGLVGDTQFAVLPGITPKTTFVLTLIFQSVSTQWTGLQEGDVTCN